MPDTIEEATQKVGVQGTFYADALNSLSASSAAERTAKAAEEIKKNTKKTNDLLENNDDTEFE